MPVCYCLDSVIMSMPVPRIMLPNELLHEHYLYGQYCMCNAAVGYARHDSCAKSFFLIKKEENIYIIFV